MRRLRMVANERLDINRQIKQLSTNVEDALRQVASLVFHGTGVVRGMAYTYDSGTRRFTFGEGWAIDPAGNFVAVRSSVVSTPLSAGDVGVTPMYVWCAVDLGTIAAETANSIKYVPGTGEVSFPTETQWHDDVKFVPSATQPANTAAGAEYFKVLEIVSWSGGVPNLPVVAYYHAWEHYRDEVSGVGVLGANGGSVQEAIERIATAIEALGGAQFTWATPGTVVANVKTLSDALTALTARTDVVEAYLNVVGYEAVGLAPVYNSGGWAYDPLNHRWEASDTGEKIVFDITRHDRQECLALDISAKPGDMAGLKATLFRMPLLTGATAPVAVDENNVTWAAGGTHDLVTLGTGSGVSLQTQQRWILVVETTGSSGGTDAILYGAWSQVRSLEY